MVTSKIEELDSKLGWCRSDCVCVGAGDRLLDDLMLVGRVETDGVKREEAEVGWEREDVCKKG